MVQDGKLEREKKVCCLQMLRQFHVGQGFYRGKKGDGKDDTKRFSFAMEFINWLFAFSTYLHKGASDAMATSQIVSYWLKWACKKNIHTQL